MSSGDKPEKPPAPNAPGQFPATRWTLIGRAGGSDTQGGSTAIAELVRLYAPALRAHLLAAVNRDEHRADDLLQGFLTDKVLEERLIGFADPNRGRFRTFLLTALDRYVIDEHRRATAQKRAPREGFQDIDQHTDSISTSAGDSDQHAAFDRAWASEVVREVIATMRQECQESGRQDLWEVFDVRCLKPATDDLAPEPHESIASRLKLESAHHAGNLLITAKRMFTRVFKAVVSRYAANEKEVQDEVAELWRLYAQTRA